ncbi:MAG: hypothetical protein JOY78_20425 [Pseudonocardia sp.]|nr:hypothetical protein [Pseudonocardia sp.]
MTPVVLPAQIFDPPLLAPSATGLYSHVNWQQVGDPYRAFMRAGIIIRPHNYDGGLGVWGAGWCADPNNPGDLKTGNRPNIDSLAPFVPETVYGFDHDYCGLMDTVSLQEVRDRARHNLELNEGNAAERQFAARMLTDAPSPPAVSDIQEAVGQLEAALAETGTVGYIHANPFWASQVWGLVLGNAPGPFHTPLGHTWVFGGGYVEGLGNTLVATSQVFGWRGDPQFNEAFQHDADDAFEQFIAVAERSVLLGYEKLVAAVHIS